MLRWIFTSSAMLTIIALAMIIFLFFRESISFFPEYQKSLQNYRISGTEYVDLLNDRYESFIEIDHELIELRARWIRQLGNQALPAEDLEQQLHQGAAAQLFQDFRRSARPWRAFIDEKTQFAIETRQQIMLGRKELQTWIPERQAELRGNLDEYRRIQEKLARDTAESFARATGYDLGSIAMNREMTKLAQRNADFHSEIEAHIQSLQRWNSDESLNMGQVMLAFFTGKKWVTASEQQNWFGLLPLLSGTLLVAGIALSMAVPLGVGSAVYVNQLAGTREKAILKPAIEFIAALPAVVVGFFGVMVFGELVRLVARSDALSWLPFLQVQERLNAFTAGSLLALMAIPTIFSLTEDALYAVRNEIKDASFAMGATRLQTAFRVVIPSALPGIVSAVLLGFGRVVGETMIVLLCAGNRVKIPEWSEGLAVIFDPVHTMTGMIAQEMGEVVYGNLHYRALFLVGFVLFILSMVVNYLAQTLTQRHQQTQDKYQQ